MTFWILDPAQPIHAEGGEASLCVTDGKGQSRRVTLRVDPAAAHALRGHSYADGPDALLEKLANVWYWKKKAQPSWDPTDEVLHESDIDKLVDHIESREKK